MTVGVCEEGFLFCSISVHQLREYSFEEETCLKNLIRLIGFHLYELRVGQQREVTE